MSQLGASLNIHSLEVLYTLLLLPDSSIIRVATTMSQLGASLNIHSLEVRYMLLMLPESSIMLLENIHSRRGIIDNCHLQSSYVYSNFSFVQKLFFYIGSLPVSRGIRTLNLGVMSWVIYRCAAITSINLTYSRRCICQSLAINSLLGQGPLL